MALKKISQITFCLVLVLTASALVAVSQDTKITEPAVIGLVHYLDGGSVVPLEKQTTKLQMKVKALGFGGGGAQVEVTGDKSTVRFKPGQKPEFVVQLPGGDPTKLKLYKFESQKGKRQMAVAKVSPFGTKGSVKTESVGCTVTKYGQSSYKLVPSQTLVPGEYGFSSADWSVTSASSEDVFLFGVDKP